MLFVTISLLVVFITTIYLWLKRHYSYWAVRNVPHEKPSFLIGNASGLGRRFTFGEFNMRFYKKYKGTTPFVGYYAFLNRAAFILDLDLIRDILIKDFNIFPDRGLFHNERDDPLTGNLLGLDGEKWRILRNKTRPVFTPGKLRFIFPKMVEVAERLVMACSGNSNEIEVKDICARYTTDMIGEVGFGIECNSLRNPNAEFCRMGRSIVEEPRHHIIIQAFMFSNPNLARKLRMKFYTDKVSNFFLRIVRETIEYRIENNINRNDFMDILIELKKLRDNTDGRENGKGSDDMSNGLTMEEVAAQAILFFLAGFETTSTAISFCLYELALNIEVQEKLRTEIQQVLKKYNEQLTYESIQDMEYLEMVICETLRKHSSLPHTIRSPIADYAVPNTNYVLEKGIQICIPIDSIHYDPDIYPMPNKFMPERFTPEEIARRHPQAFLPFGDGPRNCIGKRFAMLETKIGIVTLLRNFKFSVNERTQIPTKILKKSFLLVPEGGIYLRIEKC